MNCHAASDSINDAVTYLAATTELPAISRLLVQEAEAWRAVLNLHPVAVSNSIHVARDAGNAQDETIRDSNEVSEAREANYIANLSALVAQCDSLSNEILRLRGLRRARRGVETSVISEITRGHSHEILALGANLASNGSLQLTDVITRLRTSIQSNRNAVSQLKQILDSINLVEHLPEVPSDCEFVVGIRNGEGVKASVSLDNFVTTIYNTGREINYETINSAVSELLLGNEKQSDGKRNFVRRSSDR